MTEEEEEWEEGGNVIDVGWGMRMGMVRGKKGNVVSQ